MNAPLDTQNVEDREKLLSEHVQRAKEILVRELTNADTGSVSTKKLKKLLAKGNVASDLINEIVLVLRNDATEAWKHGGASFFTADAYNREQAKIDEAPPPADAPSSEDDSAEPDDAEEASTRAHRTNKQEERRLTHYVVEFLKGVYEPTFDHDHEYVFNVFDKKPGRVFSNPDILAFDWRSEQIAETVAVEVKLQFSSHAIQQAANYCRFTQRVWVAFPLPSEWKSDVTQFLRSEDSLLFDYVVALGIGIIGCRRALGRSYECSVVQWPRMNNCSEIEKASFRVAYNDEFIEAGLEERRRVIGRVA